MSNLGKSLAFQKFQKSIEAEIRNYWYINTAMIYGQRWWHNLGEANFPVRVTQYPGDDKKPFTSIDISPNEYLGNLTSVIKFGRENSIIGFITAFEVYLLDIVGRILFLDPTLIDSSTMPFEAQEIATVLNKQNFVQWFANKVADKYMRNKTHLKMILRLQQIIKYELYKPNKDLIEEWNKWTYVRNAIVHNGREVSKDLFEIWPVKFPNLHKPLNLTDSDLIRVQYLAVELSKIIDRIIVDRIIQNEDAILLIREFFIKDGLDDNKELRKLIFLILGNKVKAPLVDKALGFQRRTGEETIGWNFSHYNFTP